MTLWILFCRVNAQVDTLFPFYAKHRKQAEQQAAELLQEYHYKRLELKTFPCGFRIVCTHLPGTIEDASPDSRYELQENRDNQ